MTIIYDLIHKGGPIMWVLLGLSILTLTCAFERGYFWWQLISQEDKICRDVLDTAQSDLMEASLVAYQGKHLAIGRFLLIPLQLNSPNPNTFQLAIKSSMERELVEMRKGNKLLETVVVISPFLGLLGTVVKIITSFNNVDLGNLAGGELLKKLLNMIGETLTFTAIGMAIAIMAYICLQIFTTLQSQQRDYFQNVGNQLELIYRDVWFDNPRFKDMGFSDMVQKTRT
jgi:biopolymer transport protein ExbB